MNGWLIDTLVYTGVLIGAVLVLRRPLGQAFGPQIAYALWALPFIRLLLPPIVLPARFAPESASAVDSRAASLPAGAQWVPAAEAAPPAPVEATPMIPISVEPATIAPAVDWALLGEIALSLWAGGALAFLAWRVVTYRRMRRELLAEARPVGEIGHVRLVETPVLAAPVAFGVLDKVIALPPLFMAQPDLVARDLAIEHELAHHRGHDLLANFAAQALLALHWFNPLAWYGWRAMRRDQEAACDARVLAGRGRDERLRYAALIAGVAAGPRAIGFRGALAAPMACPVLGEKSVIHRLRSMSMADITPGRLRLGRGLVVAAATLALPLTASISFSVANAQAPASPAAAPLPPVVAIDPDAPDAPAAPDLEQAEARAAHLRAGLDGQPEVTDPSLARIVPTPPMPAMPRMEFNVWGGPNDPEFERRMAEWGEQMGKWGEEYGRQWEQWAEQHNAQALAWAEQARAAAEVVESCDAAEPRVTADGRPRVIICEREIERRALASARAGLRGARASIASSRAIDDEVRREILQELDAEIAVMERGED